MREEHVRAQKGDRTQHRAGKERTLSSELKQSLWTKGHWFYGNLGEVCLVNCGKLVYSGPSHQAQMMQGMGPLVRKLEKFQCIYSCSHCALNILLMRAFREREESWFEKTFLF